MFDSYWFCFFFRYEKVPIDGQVGPSGRLWGSSLGDDPYLVRKKQNRLWPTNPVCWEMPHLQEILWMEILHPFDMWLIPLFTRFYLSQVLQDSFHQQYIHFHAGSMLHCHVYQRCSVNSFSFTFGGSLLQERSLSLHTRR